MRRPLRIAFMGSPDLAVPCLDALRAAPDMELAQVVTVGDCRRTRRGEACPTAVGERALALGLPLFRWEKGMAGEAEALLAGLDLDAVVVIAFARILKPSLLALPRLGCLNLHASLLPWGRGASPIQQAILEGLSVTGWSAMLMEERLDAGPVLAREELAVAPDWTSADLAAALGERAPAFLLETLRAWDRGELSPEPQDEARATYACCIEPGAGAIDWRLDAADLARRVRAYQPSPGAWFRRDGARVRLRRAAAAPDGGGAAPGTVIAVRPAWRVACGAGALDLHEVVPEGRHPMPTAAYLNGRPSRPGEILENG